MGSKADWFYFRLPNFVAKDPQTRISFKMIRLNLLIPHYSLTSEGLTDHFKLLFFRNQVNEESGKPGFPVPDEGFLACETIAVFRCLGCEKNPFDADPEDYRLSCGALITLDFATDTVAGFLITATRAYLLYERWPLKPEGVDPAAFFSYVIPSTEFAAGTEHRYRIRYSKSGAVEWYIDNTKVFAHEAFGTRLPPEKEEYLVLPDLQDAGDPADLPVVVCDQRAFGAGLLTYLDAGKRKGEELVDVHAMGVEKEKKIFGQGGEMALGEFSVFSS
ncbi:MAG: DUF6081 family protein [Methanomicrobiaceae archaeon]|nr:DUF6081 family protein [Methanomicrobiaceae archaeon]